MLVDRVTSSDVGGGRPRCHVAGQRFHEHLVRSAGFEALAEARDSRLVAADDDGRLSTGSYGDVVPVEFAL